MLTPSLALLHLLAWDRISRLYCEGHICFCPSVCPSSWIDIRAAFRHYSRISIPRLSREEPNHLCTQQHTFNSLYSCDTPFEITVISLSQSASMSSSQGPYSVASRAQIAEWTGTYDPETSSDIELWIGEATSRWTANCRLPPKWVTDLEIRTCDCRHDTKIIDRIGLMSNTFRWGQFILYSHKRTVTTRPKLQTTWIHTSSQ